MQRKVSAGGVNHLDSLRCRVDAVNDPDPEQPGLVSRC